MSLAQAAVVVQWWCWWCIWYVTVVELHVVDRQSEQAQRDNSRSKLIKIQN